MRLSSRLDCDLVAVEQIDELTLLVELTAPNPSTARRAPATLQVVLDRSGSMGGERLTGAIAALLALVDRLDPSDNLGVVAFDDQVQVVVPAGPLRDKVAVKQALGAIVAGGSTDLSGGYLRGLQEARRVCGPTGATLLLISDGHANAGMTDAASLGKVAAEAHSGRITTSTLGFGLGYDERLLAALARGGAGNELFAEGVDSAVGLISGEVDGLLSLVAQAATLEVRLTPSVTSVRVLNDLQVTPLADGILVELGSFYAGETRRLVLRLDVPGIPALGLAEVATLVLCSVALPGLVQHTETLPITVNVVPGDQAAGRVRDPEVRSEALFQQTQQAKKRSSDLLSRGETGAAMDLLRSTGAALHDEALSMPPAYASELTSEALLMGSLADEAQFDSSRAAKVSSTDAMRKSRTRGRQATGGTVVMSCANRHLELVLDEWQLQQLARLLPVELARKLRPSRNLRDGDVAQAIADTLGHEHPARDFFVDAALLNGFFSRRA